MLLNKEPAFYFSVSKELCRIAFRMDVPWNAVEDLVGAAWLKAVRRRDKFEGPNIERRLSGWLRKAVRWYALNWLHRRGLLVRAAQDVAELDPIDEIGLELLENAEQEEELRALLAKGCVGHETNHYLVCEHYLNGRSVKELAAEFGTSAKAIACRIGRHLAYLRSLTE